MKKRRKELIMKEGKRGRKREEINKERDEGKRERNSAKKGMMERRK
jgi:hypothetical protein